MTRAPSFVLVLVVGCGPMVATGDGTGEDDSGSRDDDDGDDRPGTGPRPTTSPDGGPVDGEGEGEVDEGWKPDFDDGVACDELAIASCYSAVMFDVPYEVLHLLVEDVGGDEWPDLVIVAAYSIFVYPGEGGSWSDPTETPTKFTGPTGVASGDMTGDGDLDLLLIDSPRPDLFFAVGDGDGGFFPPSSIGLPAAPLHVRARDIDGDDRADPIVVLEDGTVAIVRDIGGAMPPIEILEGGIWQVDAFEVASLGLAGPADDFLLAGRNSDQVLMAVAGYEQALEGEWNVFPFASESVGLAVRDFDGDDAVDIATATTSQSVALLYRGQGDGTFAAPGLLELGATASAIAGGRFGPGIEGIVAIVDGAPTVGSFDSGIATPLTDELARGPLAAGDYNGDGISDIVASTSDGFGVLALWSGT